MLAGKVTPCPQESGFMRAAMLTLYRRARAGGGSLPIAPLGGVDVHTQGRGAGQGVPATCCMASP